MADAASSVALSFAPPLRRYSLRARDPSRLEEMLGAKIPRRIGETLGGVACLGPDEWLLRSEQALADGIGAAGPISMVDVSDRSVCIIVEGPAAAATLASGCPLDLERFAVGRATRTIYETVEIVLIRESETRFAVEVWRSFAEWLWLALHTAARND